MLEQDCTVWICKGILHKIKTTMQSLTYQKKFKDKGCLCKVKESGRPATPEEKVEGVRLKTRLKLQKSIRRIRLEILFPVTIIWQVVIKCLIMKPYKFGVFSGYSGK